MAKTLSRSILRKNELANCKGINIPNSEVSITHDFFADDTLLFGRSSISEEKCIKRIFDTYTNRSSQVINLNKSKVFFLFTPKSVKQIINNILGFSVDELPSVYSGILFFLGSVKASFCDNLINRLKGRILA